MAQTEAELLDNRVAGRPTLTLRSPDFHAITEVVAAPVEGPAPIGWWLFFIPSLAPLGLLGVAVPWLFWEGVGIWGLNVPVGWAWDITHFVFWVGIGTLIWAILFLFRQKMAHRIVSAQVRDWSMMSIEARTPDEALEIVRGGLVRRCAILDMHMPGMDGLTSRGRSVRGGPPVGSRS